MPENHRTHSRGDGKYVIGRAADVPPGVRLLVNIEGREVGIFNVDGTYRAILNRCPHRGGELCKGDVLGLVESEYPGQVTLDDSKKFIVCPWHGWEFDMETGESWYDPAYNTDPARYPPARTFDVAIEHENAPERAPREFARPANAFYIDPHAHRLAGPYTAVTLPIEVEDDYLVVSLRRPRG